MGEPRIRRKGYVEDDVWTLALERVERMYELFDHVAVSFSGGKDSTATLHAVLEVADHLDKGPVRVFFFDEEAIPYETEAYMRRIAARPDVELEWYCLPVRHRNACSRHHPYWWPWAPESEHLWVRPMPPEGITELEGFPITPQDARLTIPDLAGLLFPPAKYGNSIMAMGIRATESMTRYRAVAMKSTTRLEDYIIPWNEGTAKGNVWKGYPVYDWTTEDIWTAPATMGWDYCEAYDLFEMAGVAPSSQRLSPAFGEEPIRGLWQWPICFPDVWEKMTDRVPGVNTAAMYATTILYEYGARGSNVPDGWTPEEVVTHNLSMWDEPERSQIAARIKERITWHFTKTTQPILIDNVHPVTGISWQNLITLSARGDMKNRRVTGTTADIEARAALTAKYQVEYDEWKAKQ